MVEIRFVKDNERGYKIGDIVKTAKKDAEEIISEGYAEYVEEPKEENKDVIPKTIKDEKGVSPKVALDAVNQFIEKNEFKKAKDFINSCDFSKVDNNEDAKLIAELWKLRDLVEARIFKDHKEVDDYKITDEELKVSVEKAKEKKRKKEIKSLGEKIIKGNDEEKEFIFTRRGQIEAFWLKQPFYYDKSGIFWLWDNGLYRWERGDEVDYLNSIQDTLGIETIGHTNKTELISGFKQIGRKHKPEDMKKSWVQFKDRIYEVKTGESFKASPKYFVTNPIPWKVGVNEETPMMDKYFIEWVGEENTQCLYEFIAYNLSIDKFMQRIFAFCGGGSNGKGTFIKLNYKFLGDENCVASEIKSLSENRFEVARIYRKLLCIMGEVAYDDLKNTNTLKKLGGEDKLSFEFKGKDGFTEDNTATCVCLTNSLPTTPDKSLGFYRKWFIVDFPNQFSGMSRDLIGEIPEVEFENLSKKCLRILKGLYDKPEFHNEGDFDERMKRYEDRSNPVLRFVEEMCEEVDGTSFVLREFTNLCNEYLKEKHLRILTSKQIGNILRNEGFIVGARRIKNKLGVDIGSAVAIINLKLSKLSKLSKSQLAPREGVSRNHDSNDSNNSISSEKSQETLDMYKKAGLEKQAKDILK